jgi:FkbM family methyltransferase
MKKNDLIFDVGLHKGEDTEFYLKKGFRVVAFEANPELATFCRTRFEKEIQSGQLQIIEGAIVDFQSDERPSDEILFFKNTKVSEWGTICPCWVERNTQLDTGFEKIRVKSVNFEECIEKFGVPYFMKIDIEGVDHVCLEVLSNFAEKPDFLSIEAEKNRFQKLRNELDLLSNLGYEHFQAVQQATVPQQKEPLKNGEGKFCNHAFSFGASGLFGEDLVTRWKSKTEILREFRSIFFLYKLYGDRGLLVNNKLAGKIRNFLEKLFSTQIPGWYDVHAARSCALARGGLRGENDKTPQ